MNKHPGLLFANIALVLLMVGLLLSNMTIGLIADMLALIGCGLGLFSAIERRHWKWAAIILGSDLLLLYGALSLNGGSITFTLTPAQLAAPSFSLLLLTALPGFALIPAILYASSRAGLGKQQFSIFDQERQPDITNFGLVILAIFFIVLIARLSTGGIVVTHFVS